MKKNPNKLCVLVVAALSFFLAFASSVNAQGELPEVTNGIPKHIPLKVEFINEKEPETLKHLRIKLTNTGDRNIYHIRIWIRPLDAIGPNGRPWGIWTDYGTWDGKRSLDFQKVADDDPLEPNETCVLSVPKSFVSSFKEADELATIPYPKKFLIEIGWLSFGDGTGFLGTNGDPMNFKSKKIPEQSKKTKLLDYNNSEESDSVANFFSKNLKSPSCEKPLGDFSLSKSIFQKNTPIFAQINSLDPYYCCPGNDCMQIRIIPDSVFCCPSSNPELPPIRISSSETPGTITCREGYQCLTVFYNPIICSATNGCYAPEGFPCGSGGPNCTQSYRPPGVTVREGDVGYEYECWDGINNDCNIFGADCAEPRCANTVRVQECRAICDADGDLIDIEACNGRDCFPQDPSLPVENETVCTGEIDEDCDGRTDCVDSDCSRRTECRQQCDQDDDGYLKPECDNGSETEPADCNDNNQNIPHKVNGVITEICGNGQNDDCDNKIADCDDSDCAGTPACPHVTPTPTPTPNGTPGGGEDPTPDPCMGDECCGRGTHTEIIEGDCSTVEICAVTDRIDPYTEEPIVVCEELTECEPDQFVEVCN